MGYLKKSFDDDPASMLTGDPNYSSLIARLFSSRLAETNFYSNGLLIACASSVLKYDKYWGSIGQDLGKVRRNKAVTGCLTTPSAQVYFNYLACLIKV